MRILTPKRITIVLIAEIKRLINVMKFDRWLLATAHPWLFFRMLKNIRNKVSLKDNLLFFLWQLPRKQWQIYRLGLIKNILDPQLIGYENLEQAINSGGPVIIVTCHNTTLIQNQLIAIKLHFNTVPVIDFSPSSDIPFSDIPLSIGGQRSNTGLQKIFNILIKEKRNISITFDGIEGNPSLLVDYLGNKMLFARGYPFLTKLTKAVVIPITQYIKDNNQPVLQWHPPLFEEGEAETLSEKQILEKTIEFFTNNFITENKYGVDYLFLLKKQLVNIAKIKKDG